TPRSASRQTYGACSSADTLLCFGSAPRIARCRLAAHVPPGPAEHARLACFARVRGPAAPRRRSLLRFAARSLPRRPPAYELSAHRRPLLASSAQQPADTSIRKRCIPQTRSVCPCRSERSEETWAETKDPSQARDDKGC